MFLYSETEGSRLSACFVKKGCFLRSLETWNLIILIRNNQDASCWEIPYLMSVAFLRTRGGTVRPSGQSDWFYAATYNCTPASLCFLSVQTPPHFPQSLLAFLPLAFLLTICLYFLIIFPLICCWVVLHFSSKYLEAYDIQKQIQVYLRWLASRLLLRFPYFVGSTSGRSFLP